MKPICVYHYPCADGFAAAWVFRRKFGDGVELVPGQYQQQVPSFAGRKIFLTDFSYKRDTVEKLLEQGNDITLIDHHKTALEDLDGLLPMDHSSLAHSGGMLAWKFCFPGEEPPQLLRHIEDRDLWKFELPGTREIQAALFSYEYDFDVWDCLMRQCETPEGLERLRVEGEAIERKHWKDLRELLKATQREMIFAAPPGMPTVTGVTLPVANIPYTLASDAGHAMATNHKAKAAACYFDTADGRQFSLRSLPDGPDVSAIAKLYGGGGHRNAAGFKVPRGHWLASL
jgi:oligoribonuclease NrnB/cAMP/cGMP phosphodiesterase (DHH superfamily)